MPADKRAACDRDGLGVAISGTVIFGRSCQLIKPVKWKNSGIHMIIYIGRDWPGKAAAAANKMPSERFRKKK